MLNIFSPTFNEYAIKIQEDPIAIIGWFVWLCLLVWFVIRIRDRNLKINRQILIWMAVLSLLILLFTPFLGFLIPLESEYFFDTSPIQHCMLLAAVPWLMAGGILGALPSVVLSGMSGLLLAYLDTNNIFTPLIFMTFTASFSWALRQRFRTKPYQLLRFPIFAVIFSLVIILPFIFIAIILGTEGELPFRLAAAFEQFPFAILPMIVMSLIGGIICVVTRAAFHKKWGSREPLKYPPGQLSLQSRVILLTFSILIIGLIIAFSSLWFIKENEARQSLIENIKETASFASEGMPAIISSGRNIISDISTRGDLLADSKADWENLFYEKNESFHFFDELHLMNLEGEIITSYPEANSLSISDPNKEISEILLETNENSIAIFPTNYDLTNKAAEINFVTQVKKQSEGKTRLLWGRTNLASNPNFEIIHDRLSAIEELGGSIQIIDDQNIHLYHSDPKQVLTGYIEPLSNTPTYIERISADGQAMMQYFQPVSELGWAVITSLPVQTRYEIAWESTYPLGVFGLSTILVVLLIELIAFSSASKQINQVRRGIEAVTSGKFDFTINRNPSLGEMTQLTNAYNQMVSSLFHKVQKQSDLLSVSERLSDQDNLSAAMEIIMKAALAHGVSSVRIILAGQSDSNVLVSSGQRYGMGKLNEHFAGLDEQIFNRVRSDGFQLLRDFKGQNPRRWNEGSAAPASIIAVPIIKQTKWMGVLWVTYQNLKSPDDEEVVFFKGLAQKAYLSISTISILDNAFVIRKYLENFLDQLPDAIVITDHSGKLVYKNKNSQELFDLDELDSQRIPFSSLILEADTMTTHHDSVGSSKHKEIKTGDGKYLKVIETEIIDEGQVLGKAFQMSDISRQKAQESIRSDFVTTVSHELRSPLTLIHGYAKILQLTGNLNQQQDDYIINIVDSIEDMKDLVKKLLDIGHLDGGDSLDISHFFASDLIQKVLVNVEAQAKQKNIQVKFQRPEAPLSIEADRTFLTLALKNLLENAIIFTKMGGVVSVNVRKKDEDVVFAVKDNGIGIAPLDQRHLFEKFFRGRTQLGQENSGSGLGLAIVKSIVERHGGKVSVDSQLGKGSTFFAQIPQHLKN